MTKRAKRNEKAHRHCEECERRGNPSYNHNMFRPAIYIMTNKKNGTLYVGVTSNLPKRIDEHKSGLGGQFTSRYQLHTLVYAEHADTMEIAIAREKQLKSGSRKKKIALIEASNPTWQDLSYLI